MLKLDECPAACFPAILAPCLLLPASPDTAEPLHGPQLQQLFLCIQREGDEPSLEHPAQDPAPDWGPERSLRSEGMGSHQRPSHSLGPTEPTGLRPLSPPQALEKLQVLYLADNLLDAASLAPAPEPALTAPAGGGFPRQGSWMAQKVEVRLLRRPSAVVGLRHLRTRPAELARFTQTTVYRLRLIPSPSCPLKHFPSTSLPTSPSARSCSPPRPPLSPPAPPCPCFLASLFVAPAFLGLSVSSCRGR